MINEYKKNTNANYSITTLTVHQEHLSGVPEVYQVILRITSSTIPALGLFGSL